MIYNMGIKYKKVAKKYKNKKRNNKKRFKKKGLGGALVLYGSPGSMMPLPQRLRIKVHAMVNGVFPVATGTAQRLFNVKLNSPLTPFSVPTGGGSIAWENPFVTLANIDCAGLFQLLNSVTYTQYRVLASKISMTVQPEGQSDVCYVSITPSTTLSQPANYSNAASQPYTKARIFGTGKTDGKGDWLKNYISISKLMGVRPEAVQDDVSTVYNAIYTNDPTDIMYWVVNYCQCDNVVQSLAVSYTVKVSYYLELFALSAGNLIQ